jgi:UDP-glucuronate 4-epimerase
MISVSAFSQTVILWPYKPDGNVFALPNCKFDPFNPLPEISQAPFRIFNIGNSQPVPLMDFIDAIEDASGILANKDFLPMQAGDVEETFADTSLLEDWVGFKPSTDIKDGVRHFVNWYREFYKI